MTGMNDDTQPQRPVPPPDRPSDRPSARPPEGAAPDPTTSLPAAAPPVAGHGRSHRPVRRLHAGDAAVPVA